MTQVHAMRARFERTEQYNTILRDLILQITKHGAVSFYSLFSHNDFVPSQQRRQGQGRATHPHLSYLVGIAPSPNPFFPGHVTLFKRAIAAVTGNPFIFILVKFRVLLSFRVTSGSSWVTVRGQPPLHHAVASCRKKRKDNKIERRA